MNLVYIIRTNMYTPSVKISDITLIIGHQYQNIESIMTYNVPHVKNQQQIPEYTQESNRTKCFLGMSVIYTGHIPGKNMINQ